MALTFCVGLVFVELTLVWVFVVYLLCIAILDGVRSNRPVFLITQVTHGRARGFSRNCSPDAQKPLTLWTPISQVPLTPWTPKKIDNSICVGGICIHSTIIYKLQSHTGTILPAVLHFGQETNTRAPLCPAICIPEERRGPTPPQSGQPQRANPTIPPRSTVLIGQFWQFPCAITLTKRCFVDRAYWKQASSLSTPAPFRCNSSLAYSSSLGSPPARKLLYDGINTQEPPDLAHHFSRAKFRPIT